MKPQEIKVISHLLLYILKKSTEEEQTLQVSFFVRINLNLKDVHKNVVL